MAAGSQLSRHGLAAVSLSQRPGPGWRITSAKRLRRLVELVGAAPAGADWPRDTDHAPAVRCVGSDTCRLRPSCTVRDW